MLNQSSFHLRFFKGEIMYQVMQNILCIVYEVEVNQQKHLIRRISTFTYLSDFFNFLCLYFLYVLYYFLKFSEIWCIVWYEIQKIKRELCMMRQTLMFTCRFCSFTFSRTETKLWLVLDWVSYSHNIAL